MTDTRARDRFYLVVAVGLFVASWPLGIVWLQQISVVVAGFAGVVLALAMTFGS